jgi:hypothetical protein
MDMMKDYRVNETLYFTVEDTRGAYLRCLLENKGVMDMYSIGISFTNLSKLLSEIDNSEEIKWKTNDSSLIIRGNADNLKLIFSTPDPPFSSRMDLDSAESEIFANKLKEIVASHTNVH